MITIDTRGHLCPTPLIMTKKAVSAASTGEQFEILSDNDTACQNLMSYLEELGITASQRSENGMSTICFTLVTTSVAANSATQSEPKALCPLPEPRGTGYAFVLRSNTMGAGDDALGAILMRACINSLGELDSLPSVIIMYNSGVRLAEQGCDTAASLVALAARGVEIIVCGTCVDFYAIKDKLAVGTISNMFKINSVLSTATKVVYP